MIITKTEMTLQQVKVRNKSRIVLRPLKLNENFTKNQIQNQNDGIKRNISSSRGKINEEKNICTISNELPKLPSFRYRTKRKIYKGLKYNLTHINNSKIIKNNENEDNEKKYIFENSAKKEYNKIDKEQKIKEKEKEKINKIRNLMFKRQNYMRIKNESLDKEEEEEEEEENKNVKINQFLEDMCIYGNIIKKEIEENQSKNQDKYIKIDDALKMKDSDPNLFCLGLLARNLKSIGINVVIENNESENDEEILGYEDILEEEKEEEALTSLQFITSGYLYKTKYILRFDFGEEENEELLKNKEKYYNFKNILKQKLSRDFNTPTDKIIVTYPQRGSFEVQVIFQSDEFNTLNLNSFYKKFKNEKEFEKLKNLKMIHSDLIMSACKLSKNAFDSLGNRIDGWGVGEKRGNEKYFPPSGWIGIGLKVLDKYENNIWIGMDNIPGEWCVAYHGVGDGCASDKVKKILGLVYHGGLKPGLRQMHEDCPDYYHEGEKVGRGVYCSPKIKTAQQFCGICDINGKQYYTVFMLRVKPSKRRFCNECSDSKHPYYYWVLNGTPDEIRPYRILFKCTDDDDDEEN